MNDETILADLALRGWQCKGEWIYKPVEGDDYLAISPGMARVMRVSQHTYDIAGIPDAAFGGCSDELRTMHDIICKYERGKYEQTTDGIPSHVARVASTDAPERSGIQNDRPEFGGGRPYRTRPFRKYRRS